MVLEVAILDVKPGQEAGFEAAFAEAQAIISSMDGYVSHELRRCLERRTLEDHTVGFRGSDRYQEWRRLLHHFYDPFPEVEHYEPVYGGP